MRIVGSRLISGIRFFSPQGEVSQYHGKFVPMFMISGIW